MRLADHPAVSAWQRLTGSTSLPDDVQPIRRVFRKPRKKSKPLVYRMTGLEDSRFPVIAKRCNPDAARREIAVYREILPQMPILSPQFVGSTHGDTETHSWLFLEDVMGEAYRPAIEKHRQLVGECLGLLHFAAKSVAGGSSLAQLDYLYDTGPEGIYRYLKVSQHTISDFVSSSGLNRDDRALLNTISSQCEDLETGWREMDDYCTSIPRTLVHGDLLISNMRVGDGGNSLVLFDWERSGWGIPAFDLTRFLGSALRPDIDFYLSAARRYQPTMDVKTVRRLAYVGEVFRWLDAVRWEVENLKWKSERESMRRLETYKLWMDDIRLAGPWYDNPGLAEGEWRSFIPTDR